MTDSSASSSPFRWLGFHAWVAMAYLVPALLGGLILSIEFRSIEENIQSLVHERGETLFRMIELTRDWNAGHGGVYVRVTEKTQPNPYLKHPARDLVTTDGVRLTMVNPAFMTRQISEIVEQQGGFRFHITSLKPVRPGNAPDAWESEALRAFEHDGRKELLTLVETEKGPVHRYMAPLLVKQACLGCHALQGYQLGDIRGGISVTMPAGKTLAIRDEQRARVLWVTGLASLLIALLMHLGIWRGYANFLKLKALSEGQEVLIAERTEALAERNAQLHEEIAERQRKEAQIVESEARYRSVIQTSQNGILILRAPDFSILFANEQSLELFDHDALPVLGRSILDFVHAQDRSPFAERLARCARGESAFATARVRFVRADGPDLRVGDVDLARIESGGESLQLVVSIRDVTERLASEQALQVAAAVMESAAEGIVVMDAETRILQVNPAFTAITGYRPQEVYGRLLDSIAADQQDAAFFKAMRTILAQEGRWQGEVWSRRPDGTVYVLWLSISGIQGKVLVGGGRHVATFIDITQRKAVEDFLRHKAQSDPLTDLPNRTLFQDRLQVVFNQSRRYGEEFALLYLDLDHFKEVNDTQGHAAGDAVLIEAAQRMREVVRDSDTLARLGGDEFAVVLPKISNQAEAEEVAVRIVRAMEAPFNLPGGEARVSASVGVAIYPRHGSDLKTLCEHADAALYAVKQGGRDAYRIYVPEDRAG